MTTATPPGASRVPDAQINAARTKLMIDAKLKRTPKPEIRKLAARKTTSERHAAS